MAAVGRRLDKLERCLGIAQPVPDDGGDFIGFPVEEWIEGQRDMREIHEEWAQGSDYWRRVYEETWIPPFEAAEAEAAAVGPGGVIRRRRLSEAAERQIEETLEKVRAKWGPTFDAMTAGRRRRRAPWPAPYRSGPEGVA
jgi:hypothetical protein